MISPAVGAGLKPAPAERVSPNRISYLAIIRLMVEIDGEHHYSEERAEHRVFNTVLTAVSF